MTQLELKNHQVWQDLTKLLETIDSNALAREHLDACNYTVGGYWDEEDTYYEEIILPLNLELELTSSSIGFTGKERFLQLKFILNIPVDASDKLSHKHQTIGEIVLIFNENLEFLDEHWVLDVDSPWLELKRKHQ
ncbi:hypothetical protein G7B40_015305 [Aetokthonos hydrillicola Thurmond2011]|jgi:hypothetical protein|uniref:Uncharacterized protein n=1 Tax=Aetokthonos hydrillicola Thurmond2011 TaxID=2712845 RepID=A0AAP5IBA8_9CYAN|nr:hypothetical protein [Aetokthonos hydrillicola]MBO3461641.1 hypothetical protein [Aetokthonos hydrillicola CCALA 1050]MBW4588746.1 hypothetical protein [Aetokthonos hydrillicola CCALA 1050]MDR9895920.1 hypothetical protein [Aetokthonos hydrillicola Thurmond2011]